MWSVLDAVKQTSCWGEGRRREKAMLGATARVSRTRTREATRKGYRDEMGEENHAAIHTETRACSLSSANAPSRLVAHPLCTPVPCLPACLLPSPIFSSAAEVERRHGCEAGGRPGSAALNRGRETTRVKPPLEAPAPRAGSPPHPARRCPRLPGPSGAAPAGRRARQW